jgi:hypothetical protein
MTCEFMKISVACQTLPEMKKPVTCRRLFPKSCSSILEQQTEARRVAADGCNVVVGIDRED